MGRVLSLAYNFAIVVAVAYFVALAIATYLELEGIVRFILFFAMGGVVSRIFFSTVWR